MDQPVKPFTSEGGDARKWIGRLIIAVLLGEALWGLIVSVMNNVVVPWLGDVMGQSSGLPTSFTQRPYNYPELFVSVFEFCIAGLVAAVLNYFFQRPAVRRVKTVKSSVPTVTPGPIRVVPQAATSSALTDTAPPQFGITPAASPMSAPEQDVRMYPVIPSILVPAASAAPAPPVAPAPEAGPEAIAPATSAVPKPVASKPAPPAPKAEPAKPKKPKNVYYNIVGEPMPSDDD
jgi:large-conductance mechanosensitive channel